MTAPIAIFCYNRPHLLTRSIEALARCPLAQESELHFFSDAPSCQCKPDLVLETRAVARRASGFQRIHLHERPWNYGLARNLVSGITQMLEHAESVIVLEDDMLVAPHFLEYINEGLRLYADEPRVFNISGFQYPLEANLPETFFLRGADVWGFGTWRRAWNHFEKNSLSLLRSLEAEKLSRTFNYEDTYPYTQMLHDHATGRNDSWLVRWHASTFLAGGLSLHPSRSLLLNIGFDGSGTHCETGNPLGGLYSGKIIPRQENPPGESDEARRAIAAYHRLTRQAPPVPFRQRLHTRTSATLKSLLPPAITRRLQTAKTTPPWLEGDFSSWEEASSQCQGYDQPAIWEKTAKSIYKVMHREVSGERDSVIFDHPVTPYPLLCALLRRAIRTSGKLTVLDFGGSLGSTFFACRDHLTHLTLLRWHIVEQPIVVTYGKREFEQPPLRFFDNLVEATQSAAPDVAILSGVLPYLESPYDLLHQVLSTRPGTLVIDRTPFIDTDRERIAVENVPPSIYPASYPFRFLSRKKIMRSVLNAGYGLTEEFPALDNVPIANDKSLFKGFVFEALS